MLGPNVQLLTPLHPLDAEERISGLEYGKPITIGDKVWIGGGAIILQFTSLLDLLVVTIIALKENQSIITRTSRSVSRLVFSLALPSLFLYPTELQDTK